MSDEECGTPLTRGDICGRIALRKIRRLNNNNANNTNNNNILNNDNNNRSWEESASLNTSITTISDASLSESRFEDYLTRYTVAVADFDEYFTSHNRSINNKDENNASQPASGDETDSETESAVEAKVKRAAQTLHEIFVEGCCALYSDLRDAIDDLERAQTPLFVINSQTANHFHRSGAHVASVRIADDKGVLTAHDQRELIERLRVLTRQANELAANVPQLTDTAQLRLATLERAMQQLRIRQQQQEQQQKCKQQYNTDGRQSGCVNGDVTAPSQRFRKWLQGSESELETLKAHVAHASDDLPLLQRLCADHQILQLQIETEGRALLNSAYQQLHVERQTIQSITGESLPDGAIDHSTTAVTALLSRAEKRLDRWHRNLEVLEHRWYTHWLASLESLEVIGRLVDRLIESEHNPTCCSQSEFESDGEEPLCKRLRSSLTPAPPAITTAAAAAETTESSCEKLSRRNKTQTASNIQSNPMASVMYAANTFSEKSDITTNMIAAQLKFSALNPAMPCRDVAVTVTSASSGIDEDAATDQLTTATSDAEFEHELVKERIERCGQNIGKMSAKHQRTITIRAGDNFTTSLSTALSDGGCSRASTSSSSNGAPVSHDVGYSSGENNSLLDGIDAVALTNCTIKIGDSHNSIIKSYYRTVPLDDAGVTDTECGRLLAPSLLASGDNANQLTDSLIVQVDNNNSFGQSNPPYNNNNGATGEQESLGRPLDDFEEVMEMMDEQFQTQLELLRRGTQWKELRASSGGYPSSVRRSNGNSGARSPKHKATSTPDASRVKTTIGSCDASSEESDCNRRALSQFRNAHSLTASLCCPVEAASPLLPLQSSEAPRIVVDAALPDDSDDDNALPTDLQTLPPPVTPLAPRRKRYHRRSIRNPDNKTNHNTHNTGFTTTVVVPVPVHTMTAPQNPNDNIQKISSKLKNVLMNQSVYVTGHSDAEQSPDDETNAPATDKPPAVRLGLPEQRKVARWRIHRSASDNATLCENAFLEHETPSRLMSASTHEAGGRYHRNHHYHHHTYSYRHLQPQQEHCHCCRCRCQCAGEKKCRAGLVRTCSVESCQSSSSSITVHESGDAHFEWDEYKDLCDLVMSPSCTEFEEGLNATKEKHSTPKRNSAAADSTVLNPDAALVISAEDDAFFAAGAAADAQRLLATRSPPSASDVDDSDNEETRVNGINNMCATLEESRQQLRSVEITLKSVRANLVARKRVVRKNTAYNTHANTEKLAAASAIANNNIQRLRERSRDAPILDMNQINELEKLRESWTRILLKITKMSQRCSKFETDDDNVSLPSTSDDNNNNNNINNYCGEETVSLHSVLEEMKTQLGRLMVCDGSTAPLSLIDIEKVVATRKEILRSLLQYRDDLRELTAEAKRRDTPTTAAALDRSDVLELVTLMELVEKSLHSIQSSTGSLERLREDFSSLCALFLSLDAKIERLNHAVSPGSPNSDGEPFSACANFIKAIESELEQCQKRMDALETICNTLSNHFSLAHSYDEEGTTRLLMPPAQSNADSALTTVEEVPAEPHPPASDCRNESASKNTSGQMLREFQQYRIELDRLKSRFRTALAQQESTELNDTLTVPNASPTASRKRRLNTEETRSERSSRSHSSSSFVSDAQIEQTQPTSAKTTTASVGTQSDISAETVRAYEARLDAAKAARRAARAAKEAANSDVFMHSAADDSSALACDLKRRRASPQQLAIAYVTPQCLPQKLRSALRDSRMAQLCLGCALTLAIGMLLLQVFGVTDDPRNPMLVNNYRWSFGPQLDYVAGPPPR